MAFMRWTVLPLVIALLSACDPAGRAVRVRPDKKAEVLLANNSKVPADVYVSRDGLVELQIYSSSGTMTPSIHALILNNRKQAVRVDFKNAVYNASSRPTHLKNVSHEGCRPHDERYPDACEPLVVTIGPSKALDVRISAAAQGEFRLPIYSENQDSDEIVARFERCGIMGQCETAR